MQLSKISAAGCLTPCLETTYTPQSLMKKAILTTAGLVLLAGCTTKPVVESKNEAAVAPATAGSVLRVDSALDAIVPPSAPIEKLAGGFQFIEGPLWFPTGHLWFSDVVGNVVRQWSPSGVTEILRPGGYDGSDAPAGS